MASLGLIRAWNVITSNIEFKFSVLSQIIANYSQKQVEEILDLSRN